MTDLRIALLSMLLMCCTFTLGCFHSSGGGHPKLRVYGDMDESEARAWIEQGAACVGMEAQTWGEFHCVLRPGNKFDYHWTDQNNMPQVVHNIGGIAHHQPDGSFWMHYTDFGRIKLHEFGWHVNKIKRFKDYSEPPHPWNWCPILSRFVEEEDTYPVRVINQRGELI